MRCMLASLLLGALAYDAELVALADEELELAQLMNNPENDVALSGADNENIDEAAVEKDLAHCHQHKEKVCTACTVRVSYSLKFQIRGDMKCKKTCPKVHCVRRCHRTRVCVNTAPCCLRYRQCKNTCHCPRRGCRVQCPHHRRRHCWNRCGDEPVCHDRCIHEQCGHNPCSRVCELEHYDLGEAAKEDEEQQLYA